MHKCQNCNSQITEQFAKVYGDNDDTVYRCIHCIEPKDGGRSVLRNGGAAIEDIEEVYERMNNLGGTAR